MTLVSSATVDLSPGAPGWLELRGGDHRGGDTFNSTVASWPGWRRAPVGHAAGIGSLYRAAAWPAAALPLIRSTLSLRWSPAARAWLEATQTAAQHAAAALRAHRPAGVELSTTIRADVAGRPLMAHQVQALLALEAHGNVALLTDDMGLGKTATSIVSWARSNKKRLLVVCPKSVKLNWEEEIELAFGGKPFMVYMIDGTQKQRERCIRFMRAVIDEGTRAVAIVNYDLLIHMKEEAWSTLEAWVAQQAFIGDEFHYCKDADSKRSVAVKSLAHRAFFRLGLTGTPVRNTVEDLFSQIEIIRPGTFISYHDFANRHLVQSAVSFSGSKRKTTVTRGGKHLDRLNEILSTMRVGREKNEVLTLPPKIVNKPKIELDGVHRELYDAMKNFARVELEKLMANAPKPCDKDTDGDGNCHIHPEGCPQEITVFHPAARSSVEAAMRCEMIAQGFLSGLPEIYAEMMAEKIAANGERVPGRLDAFVFPTSPKMAWLLEQVESLLKANRQVVIPSRFNAPIAWLEAHLNEKHDAKCTKMIGSLDSVARQQEIVKFQRGESKVMLVQVKLGEGFNLTSASDMIFLGRDWAPAINAQMEARCHRIGSKGTVNIQIPIVVKTVEVLIERKLAAKTADAQQALRTTTIRELIEAL